MSTVGGRITALAAQRVRRGRGQRVSVFLDGAFAFGVDEDVAAREGLRVGKVLSADDIARLNAADDEARFYNDALRFLSYRPRSSAEVARYLRDRGAADEMAAAVMERLRHLGLVDDEAFARYWIENRGAFSPRGSRALQAELRARGVEADAIEAALEDSGGGEEERAYQAGLKRMRLLRAADEEEFRRRMYGFLQRRGFDYETARHATDRLWQERQGDPPGE